MREELGERKRGQEGEGKWREKGEGERGIGGQGNRGREGECRQNHSHVLCSISCSCFSSPLFSIRYEYHVDDFSKDPIPM